MAFCFTQEFWEAPAASPLSGRNKILAGVCPQVGHSCLLRIKGLKACVRAPWHARHAASSGGSQLPVKDRRSQSVRASSVACAAAAKRSSHCSFYRLKICAPALWYAHQHCDMRAMPCLTHTFSKVLMPVLIQRLTTVFHFLPQTGHCPPSHQITNHLPCFTHSFTGTKLLKR